MLTAMKTALAALLWLTCFLSLRHGLELLAARKRVRSRLTYPKRGRLSHRMDRLIVRYARFFRHLRDLLETNEWSWGPGSFLILCAVLFLSGIVAGGFLFAGVKGMFSFGMMLGALPYVLLRMRLLSAQMKRRLEFLPAVEIFYQYYVLSEHKNIRGVLFRLVEEGRIMYPMRTVFEQLQRHLATRREVDDSLRLFQLATGHVWADYFANILRVGLLEGADVTENLRELIEDMRKARLADQAEKNRLLEIRIANFTPILFLALFMFINFKMDRENAYFYYFIDPAGRSMLLDSLLLIFLSFVMGIYLSIKRM